MVRKIVLPVTCLLHKQKEQNMDPRTHIKIQEYCGEPIIAILVKYRQVDPWGYMVTSLASLATPGHSKRPCLDKAHRP